MTTSQHPKTQLTLPGQVHTAEGRHDHSGMYVMHFGFRRDLAYSSGLRRALEPDLPARARP